MPHGIEKDAVSRKRKKLGELLVDAGLLDEKTLAKALEIQKIKNKRIGQIFIDMGVADELEIAKALATQLKIPLIRLKDLKIPQEVVALIPQELAEQYILLPVKKEEKGLLVAMANPLDLYALDDLRFLTQMPIRIAVAPEKDILDAIGRLYPQKALEKALTSGPQLDEGVEVVQRAETEDKDLQDVRELLNLTERPPVVRLTNAILGDAIRMRASDIHIEPQKTAVVVRYRIDGILREIMKTDRHVHAPLVSRIKVISNMDISIRRKPQDGRSQVKYKDAAYDMRVSSIPTAYGEKVTIRLLNPHAARIQMEELGLPDQGLIQVEEAITKPQGIFLVTGPTGSGKSSTLYACLNRLNSSSVNIVTVEDPIEYEIEGVNQVQINPKAGITFAEGLRSILRQDPDIIMVGEIRDAETARIAFQAAQTGHMVLSTLHTNDAPSAILRLLDLEIENFLISSALVAVIGQRLVRKTCPACKAPDAVDQRLLERLLGKAPLEKSTFFQKGLGCEACQYTGYSGRMGVFEVLTLTPSIKEVIVPNVTSSIIRKAAERQGFQAMTLDGLRKAMQGMTTIEEVFRVVPPEVGDMLKEPPEPTPAAEEKELSGTTDEPAISSLSSPQRKKILVVDDSEIILKIVRHILETENFLVITAADGLEALKLTFQEKPDLIITDYLMPKLDGIALIKKLKSQLTTRFIPLIMLTAKEEVDIEVQGIDAGADDYLTKPVNPKRLVARVNRLLNRQ